MTNVKHVARYIIEQLGSVTTMKLHKLTYYAQAWSLAWDGVPLFEEDFQAWANGPVCVDLFIAHRGQFEVEYDFLTDYANYPFTTEQIETINVVLKDYGNKSPHYLSELTHMERPWKEARGNTPPGEISHNIIEKQSMQDYYSGLL